MADAARVSTPTEPTGPMDLRDVGIPRSAVLGSVLGLGLVAGGAGFALGQSPTAALASAGAVAAAALTVAALVTKKLRSALHQPVEAILRAMDQLRMSGQAGRVAEDGAPLLQPLLRRFNLAGSALEQRSRQSLNNLMNAEAAFDRVYAVLQSMREGVVVIDTNGRVVIANKNARRMLQLGDRRLESETFVTLMKGSLQTAMENALLRAERDKLAEVRVDDVEFEERFYDLTIVKVQGGRDVQDYGKVVVLADVTHDHEVNRLKDELLSSISHELRTPLTNMISSSEILTTLTAADEAEWREFAGMLNSESRRLKVLVDDIMEYGLLETGRIEWQREPADVGKIARTAVDVLRTPATHKRVTVAVSTPELALANVDARRCNEAICRILDNAIKFTPENGRVQVDVLARDQSIDIVVADSGPGIPAADRARVFERFVQLGDVMVSKPQGAGLGLAIVQRIVEAFGGSVHCEDSPLGGAQFRIALPAAKTALRA